jgi:hypothetical protein
VKRGDIAFGYRFRSAGLGGTLFLMCYDRTY